jgi:hypothetical protein
MVTLPDGTQMVDATQCLGLPSAPVTTTDVLGTSYDVGPVNPSQGTIDASTGIISLNNGTVIVPTSYLASSYGTPSVATTGSTSAAPQASSPVAVTSQPAPGTSQILLVAGGVLVLVLIVVSASRGRR